MKCIVITVCVVVRTFACRGISLVIFALAPLPWRQAATACLLQRLHDTQSLGIGLLQTWAQPLLKSLPLG